MANIRPFKAQSIAPPRGLSGDALAEWNRTVEALRTVGMLTRVRRRALYRYVRAFERAEILDDTIADRRKLLRQMQGLADRLQGPDHFTVLGAIAEIDDRDVDDHATIRQLRMSMLRFLRAHRLTPASRAQE